MESSEVNHSIQVNQYMTRQPRTLSGEKIVSSKMGWEGLICQSSGQDSALPMQGAQV